MVVYEVEDLIIEVNLVWIVLIEKLGFIAIKNLGEKLGILGIDAIWPNWD